MAQSELPPVSVVIPMRNAEAWIAETLASVIAQGYPAPLLDIVVVDDGSTDASVTIARSVLEATAARWTLLKTAGVGPSGARNTGWHHARGQWIQFLDSDDLLVSHKIALQAQHTRGRSPALAVVYSPWQRIRQVDQAWVPVGAAVSPWIGEDPIADLLETDNFLQLGSPLIRRDWLERVGGFDEQHWLVEDVELLLKIAMAGGVFELVPSQRPVLLYRDARPGSLSRRDQHELVTACIRNARFVEEYWKSTSGLTPRRARVLAHVYQLGARHFAECDEPAFHDAAGRMRALVGTHLPGGPTRLRFAARCLGYERAEKLAVMYRRAKRWLFP
jgi:glycosyltransferase involved in cell wall biosynthesis